MQSPVERRSILVVDDIVDNIDVLVEILRDDFHVKVAVNGETALRIATSKSPPDLILLDIVMPGMDGYEVCRRLKEDVNTHRIPVIFVTSKGDVKDESLGFALGAEDYITKPVSPPIVRARVATHLALFDQRRDLEMEVRKRTEEIEDTRLEIIRRLGRAAEYRDNETGMHVIRMSQTCRLLAREIGMTEEEADLILHATPMHDVGKIGIPDDILLKPGPLNDKEWGVMKRHCEYGVHIIGEHRSPLLKAAGVIAHEHHEYWDGTGYPRGLAGEAISPYARITTIADVFDALTSRRPYKEPWLADRAIAHMQEMSSRQFDPDIFPHFIEILPLVMEIQERFSD